MREFFRGFKDAFYMSWVRWYDLGHKFGIFFNRMIALGTAFMLIGMGWLGPSMFASLIIKWFML